MLSLAFRHFVRLWYSAMPCGLFIAPRRSEIKRPEKMAAVQLVLILQLEHEPFDAFSHHEGSSCNKIVILHWSIPLTKSHVEVINYQPMPQEPIPAKGAVLAINTKELCTYIW